ncbi:hypothetical protein BDW68DRAFT_154141 [Aspergillus falconensis]
MPRTPLPFPPPVSSGASLIDDPEQYSRDISNLTGSPQYHPTPPVLYAEQYLSSTPNSPRFCTALAE